MMRLFLALLFVCFSLTAAHAQQKTPLPAVPAASDEKALCKARPGCRLMWARPAGKDDKGREMVLQEVVIAAPVGWGCRRPPNELNGEYVKDVRQEIWLTLKGGILPENIKVMDLCNDGYGAADVGEDRLDIEEGFVTRRAFGGGALRWMNGQRLRLPALEVEKEYACSMHSLYGGDNFRVMDYETGAFRIGWSEEVQGDGEEPAREDFIDCTAMDVASANARYQALPLKQINSFLGLRLNEVKGLGSCATTLTTKPGPHQGYIVFGQDDGAEAEIRALRVNDDQLWVNVQSKGRSFTASKDWSKDDRIEIWWLEEKTPHAGSPARRSLRQFAVRLADVGVFGGYGTADGKRKLPYVERRSGEGLSFIIRWPPEQFASPEGMTLVYARGDGKETGVMWATSTLKYGRAETLGPVINLQQKARDPMQSCRIDKEGLLQLVRPEFVRPTPP